MCVYVHVCVQLCACVFVFVRAPRLLWTCMNSCEKKEQTGVNPKPQTRCTLSAANRQGLGSPGKEQTNVSNNVVCNEAMELYIAA